MTVVRRLATLARAATRVDRGQLAVGPGLMAALGLALPLAIGLLMGQPRAGATAALGALPVGVASLVGTYQLPLRAMAVTSAAVSLSALAGSLSADVLPLRLAVLAGWGAAAGLLVALGPAGRVIGASRWPTCTEPSLIMPKNRRATALLPGS